MARQITPRSCCSPRRKGFLQKDSLLPNNYPSGIIIKGLTLLALQSQKPDFMKITQRTRTKEKIHIKLNSEISKFINININLQTRNTVNSESNQNVNTGKSVNFSPLRKIM